LIGKVVVYNKQLKIKVTKMKYYVIDLYSGKKYLWSVDKILEIINRDRSSKWTNYDKSDWKEGWSEWCEGDIYSIPSINKGK
tara:strand:- start:956 stop:1201 length:246 start_codon:yes stop_codon:yes gene_type:complete